jgi:hypothetical protein
MTYNSETGVFATYQFPALGGGLAFHPVYNANNLRLTVGP